MKKSILLTTILASIFFTGCSSFYVDLNNLAKDKVYTVKHLKEVKAEYDENGVQTNVTYDENENIVLSYELAETETLKGKYDSLTTAAAKAYEGFTPQAFNQITITKESADVIEIKYNRNETTISFNPNGGLWDFATSKSDKETKSFTRKYGSSLPEISVSSLGKRLCTLSGWKDSDGNVITAFPESFTANNITYTAEWENSSGIAWAVRYLFEPADSTDENDYASYITDSSYPDEIQYAEEGETTIVHFAEEAVGAENEVLVNSVDGFSYAKDIEQEAIASDGSTVIGVYYKRNTYTVTLNPGSYEETEAVWNYAEIKAGSTEKEKEPKVITGKFGAAIDSSIYSGAGIKSCFISGWQKEDGTVLTSLPETIPFGGGTYTAVWTMENETSYTVEHWFENTDCTDISDESAVSYSLNAAYTETKTGVPETNTTAESKTVTGFTAKDIKQKEIAAGNSTVVKIYYVRNSIDIKFATDEGIWNYDEWKADKSGVFANQNEKTISGKYGTVISYPDFSKLKKIGKNLSGFSYKSADETKTISVNELKEISIFSENNVSYTAIWTDKAPVSYTVKHWTEMVSSNDSDDASNYELNGTDTTKKGIPEYYTEASYKTITGFQPTASEIPQEEIEEDGSTVINLYYKRSIYKIVFDSNGGVWNYADYKNNGAAPDSLNKEIEGKYGTTVVLPNLNGLGKTSSNFLGWTSTGGSMAETLPAVYGASDVTYTAIWTLADGYTYTVKHLFQSTDGTSYVENESLRETGAGVKDELTEAVPKTVKGFTAVTPVTQVSILDDNSAVVEIKYTRNSSKFIFDANGGNIVGNQTVSGLYESSFNKADTPSATKSGWTFAGWMLNGTIVSDSNNQLDEKYFGIEDVTYTAHWVATVNVGTIYSAGDITMTIQDNTEESQYECSVNLPSGFEDKTWTNKWYVDGIYIAESENFVRAYSVLGKGKHTITVKAVHNGNVFTASKTIFVQ